MCGVSSGGKAGLAWSVLARVVPQLSNEDKGQRDSSSTITRLGRILVCLHTHRLGFSTPQLSCLEEAASDLLPRHMTARSNLAPSRVVLMRHAGHHLIFNTKGGRSSMGKKGLTIALHTVSPHYITTLELLLLKQPLAQSGARGKSWHARIGTPESNSGRGASASQPAYSVCGGKTLSCLVCFPEHKAPDSPLPGNGSSLLELGVTHCWPV